MRTVTIANNEEIIKFLSDQTVCHLSTASLSGKPYVIPMNYGMCGDEIVLHAGPEGRLIDLLKENQNVCLSISNGDKLKWQDEHIGCSYRMESTSAVIEGTLRFITELDEKTQYLDCLMKHYSDRSFSYSEPALRNVSVMVVKVDTLACRKFGVPTHIARKMEGTTLVTKKDDE